MASPYRAHDESRRNDRPRAELVYASRDQEGKVAGARTAIQIAVAGTIGGAIAAGAGLPELGAAIIVGATAFGMWRWRRAPDVTGLLLRVENGELVIIPRGSKKVLMRTRLVDLRNVSLDTKSIRKVEPGRDAVPALQFINTSVGPEIDVARIVLHVEGRRGPIRLTEAFLSHIDSVEWTGKIRTFLRAQGWVPEDEREAVTSERFRIAEGDDGEEQAEEEEERGDDEEKPVARAERQRR